MDETGDEVDRFYAYLNLTYQSYDPYHSHKELVTHAILALEFGFLAFVATTSNLALPWHEGTILPSAVVLVAERLLLSAAFITIHKFLLNQLRYQRVAAIWLTAIEFALQRAILAPPNLASLSPTDRLKKNASIISSVIDKCLFPYLAQMPHTRTDNLFYTSPDFLRQFLDGVSLSPGKSERLLAAVSLTITLVAIATIWIRPLA